MIHAASTSRVTPSQRTCFNHSKITRESIRRHQNLPDFHKRETRSMADVRSMLRAERVNRRITHPNASYTSDDRLLCNLCDITIKSETAWSAHLHSSQHSLRLHRAQDAAVARGSSDGTTTVTMAPASKKRKASMLESPVAEDKKRVRSSENVPLGSIAQTRVVPVVGESDRTPDVGAEIDGETSANHVPTGVNGVDDAEFEAFEREIAALDEMGKTPPASRIEPTVAAAPLTAEQIAAKSQEKDDGKRSRRDAEIEADQEDAARILEQEFEEMEGLEERVRRLREKREALRKESTNQESTSSTTVKSQPTVAGDAGTTLAVNGDVNEGNTEANDEDEEGDDDDDDDEFDDWRFGST